MPKRLAQALVARGLVSASDVEQALRHQATQGGALDTALLELQAVEEQTLLSSLAELAGLKPLNLGEFEPNLEVARFIPGRVAERLGVVPLSIDGDVLHVACAYPVPAKELQEVGFLLGKRLELWAALEYRVQEWRTHLYHVPLAGRFRALVERVSAPRAVEEPLALPDVVEQLARAVVDEPLQPADAWAPADPDFAGPVPAPVPAPAPALATELAGVPAQLEEWTVPVPAHVLSVTLPPPPPDELPMPDEERPRAQTSEVPPSPAPAPVPGDPAAPIATPPPRGMTLTEARAALRGASHDRERLLEVALSFGQNAFAFVAALAVVKGQAVPWAAKGTLGERAKVAGAKIPLDAQSLFRTVVVTRGSYFGPVPADQHTRRYLGELGRAPRTLFLFPIEVRSRVVALLYADGGQEPVSRRALSEYLLFCQELPAAFGELILFRKQRAQGALHAIEQPASHVVEPPALSSEPPAPFASAPTSPASDLGWSPSKPTLSAPPGRSAAAPGVPLSEEERPPPDFAPLLQRLTGPDAAQRASAMALLARTPEAAALELAKTFPGPSAWSKVPVSELPEAEELGPIPGALARLGRAGAHALAPLLDSEDTDARYLALLLAGNLPFGEVVDGVGRALFDLDPHLSSAARAASGALKRLPRFDAVLKELRSALSSEDALRRTLAAKALGSLHDRASVEALIATLAGDDQLCSQAAADALREITKQAYGTKQRAWEVWWTENRQRRRVDWLVAGLRHKELDVRLSAIEELAQAFNDNLGYFADARPAERETAVRRWEATVARSSKAGFDL